MREVTRLLGGGTFFESPRWHRGRWWVSDFYADGGRILAIHPEGAIEREIALEQPSGLGWLPGGDLLAVSMSGHKIWRIGDDGEPALHADISALSRGEANDMCVDAEGRAWVGSFGYDLYAGEQARGATLMRVDPDGSVHAAAEGLHFPNSMMVPPPGDTLIVAETIAARLSAFTIGADGALSDRRVYAQIAPTPPLAEIDAEYTKVGYGPDGCTLDAEGCIWAGNSLGPEIARVAPGGEILETIPAPEPDSVIYATMLGGEDGCTLLLCVAPDWRLGMDTGERRASLYTTRVEVPHHGGLP
ncbi:MAG TPA: SMP-30/gluconolactonase/LRE family protein [Solirubrobacterales bacterium]|nr:SMP-30/gluconolactonase/LRE family protein [Solirubrobacterales bacterium]